MKFLFTLNLLIIIFFTEGSFAAVCELKSDPKFPRKHDIRMPDGRLISIVTHTHPKRHNPQADQTKLPPTFEKSLTEYYSVFAPRAPKNEEGKLYRKFFSQSIRNGLTQNERAAQDFREDYIQLKRVLDSYKYDIIGIESSSSNIKSEIESKNPTQVIKDTQKLVDEGFLTQEQATSVLAIHLNPAGYLLQTNPELMKDKEIKGLANARFTGTIADAEKFCENHEPPIKDHHYPSKSMELLKQRGISKTEQDTILQAFTSAFHQNITGEMLLKGSTFGKVKASDILSSFKSISKLSLTSKEKETIKKDAQSIIDWLNGPQCHYDDYLEIEHLLKQNKSLIYFVGGAHLKNFKQYLEVACRKARGAHYKTKPDTNESGSKTVDKG